MRITTKCSIAIHCLLFIYEYGEIRKITSELLALSTGCNPAAIRSIISALKKEGILSVQPGTGGTKLACAPEEITLYRICMALEPSALRKLIGLHPLPSVYCPIGRNIHGVLEATYEKIRADMQESLQSLTLQDVIEQYRLCDS
ncbi:MAG: Rrf2 family transcriptional regulator [Provencibacterium sp.]|nr:Rrf2 family transcriptional regulator [Provencibacterium sp.]